MEDSEGGLSFDFEGGLDAGPGMPTASNPAIQSDSTAAAAAAAANANHAAPSSSGAAPDHASAPVPHHSGRRSFRQTVCRHWLRSLCMKGDACGFLHQYDKSRMPVCRFFRLFGECREQDCVYKHTNEDIKECNMYKFPFLFLEPSFFCVYIVFSFFMLRLFVFLFVDECGVWLLHLIFLVLLILGMPCLFDDHYNFAFLLMKLYLLVD